MGYQASGLPKIGQMSKFAKMDANLLKKLKLLMKLNIFFRLFFERGQLDPLKTRNMMLFLKLRVL
jgi:hypothetical protein